MIGLIQLLTALAKFVPWIGDFVARLKARQNEKEALRRRTAKRDAIDDRIDDILREFEVGKHEPPNGKTRLPGSGESGS